MRVHLVFSSMRRLWVPIVGRLTSTILGSINRRRSAHPDRHQVPVLPGLPGGLGVESVTHVSLFFNGQARSGQFDGVAGLDGAIVSFDALRSRFTFAASDVVNGDFAYETIRKIVNAPVVSDTAVASATPGSDSLAGFGAGFMGRSQPDNMVLFE